MTGLPVDHRFENHKNGYKSARLVRKYGVRLVPEMYEYLNPMPYEHAVQMEKDLPTTYVSKAMPLWAVLEGIRIWRGRTRGGSSLFAQADEHSSRVTG
jgi:hypothetical protein